MTEQILARFRDRIATASRAPLRLQGGGTKQWYGNPVHGSVLDTRDYAGIVDYDPSELVITARCGTPLAEVEALLAEHGQMLGFEPPRAAQATIGGMFASGLSGPRRASAGGVRDFTLGAVLMNGRGEVLRFGGRVIKNVAGYDVARLLAGSLGTLGLVLEVSLKVVPIPYAEATLQFALSQDRALDALANWSGKPNAISASCWDDGILTVRLSGARAALAHARQQLGGEALHDAERFWHNLRDQTHPIFRDPGSSVLWRLALPATAPPLELPGRQLLEWGGMQRWLAADADPALLRARALECGGHASLHRGGVNRTEVFQPLSPAIALIHRRLKNAFDPDRVFNPGRMYLDL